MRFGHFDDQNKEYVITTPQTPLPWINYLAVRIFSVWFPTQPAATAFTAMRGYAG